MIPLSVDDFDFPLPPELIAQHPAPERTDSRLLHVAGARLHDRHFTDLPALLEKGFIPDDIRTPDSTGYRYGINVAADRKSYSASAEPAEPGKTGVFSYLLEPDKNGVPVINEQKNGGKMPVN